MKNGKCTAEDFGKKVQYEQSDHEIGILIGLIPNAGGGVVVLEKTGGIISIQHSNVGGWHLCPESNLPAAIEPLMKRFGCHEPQTRELVAAILAEVKGE